MWGKNESTDKSASYWTKKLPCFLEKISSSQGKCPQGWYFKIIWTSKLSRTSELLTVFPTESKGPRKFSLVIWHFSFHQVNFNKWICYREGFITWKKARFPPKKADHWRILLNNKISFSRSLSIDFNNAISEAPLQFINYYLCKTLVNCND